MSDSDEESQGTKGRGGRPGKSRWQPSNSDSKSSETRNLPSVIPKSNELSSVGNQDSGLESMLDGKLEVTLFSGTNVEKKPDDSRGFNSLRDMMWETMRGLKDGTVKPEVADSISKMGAVILGSVKIEMDLKKKVYGE